MAYLTPNQIKLKYNEESKIRKEIINSQNIIRLAYLKRNIDAISLQNISNKLFKPITEKLTIVSKAEATKVEATKVEATKVEATKVEATKVLDAKENDSMITGIRSHEVENIEDRLERLEQPRPSVEQPRPSADHRLDFTNKTFEDIIKTLSGNKESSNETLVIVNKKDFIIGTNKRILTDYELLEFKQLSPQSKALSYANSEEVLNINFNINHQTEYLDFIKSLGLKVVHSKKQQNINKALEKYGYGMLVQPARQSRTLNTPVIISDNPKQLESRLEILLAARSQGHNNVENEISAILDQLLNKKIINKKEYLKIYNNK